MKHLKTTTKRIVAAMLAVTLVFTGIITSDITTVQAADAKTQDIKTLQGTTITMKPYDTKYVQFNKKYGEKITALRTDYFKWTSSNENVATLKPVYDQFDAFPIDMDPSDVNEVKLHIRMYSYEITALKPGTTVITATDRDDPNNSYSFTINVKEKKMTSKQKKCKHKYTVTKKATCERPGIRTCKKCKLQQYLPLIDHKLESETKIVTKYPTYMIYVCECGARFDPLDYGEISDKAADEAARHDWQVHKNLCEIHKEINSDGWLFQEAFDYRHPYQEEVTIKKCKYCGIAETWFDTLYDPEWWNEHKND